MTIAIKLISPLSFLLIGVMMPRPANQVMSLVITPLRQSVTIGSQVKIEAKLTNVSNHAITLHDTNPDCDFTVRVTDAKGNQPPKTSYNQGLKCGTRLALSRDILVTLAPGESRDQEIMISRLYALNRPGNYFVQVLRRLPSELAETPIKSETITVTMIQ